MSSLAWLLLPGRAAWLAAALGLCQAWSLPGWAVARLAMAHLAAWRVRRAEAWRRGLVGLTLLLDRCHAAEWSGQDCAFSLLLLAGLLWPWPNWRALLLYLGVAWTAQHLSDLWGPWGWLRPLPHSLPLEWAWAVPSLPVGLAALAGAAAGRPRLAAVLMLALAWPISGPVLSRRETRRLLGGRAVDLPVLSGRESHREGWLVVSNNPERTTRSDVVLLEARTPPGRGRVLVSHIQLGLRAADLVVECNGPARIVRRLARDGGLQDAGSALRSAAPTVLHQAASWETRLPAVRSNGLIQLEVDSDRSLNWRIGWARPGAPLPVGPPAELSEGQSRGLFPAADIDVALRGERGVWHWQGPWLKNEVGAPLLGDYGVERHFSWRASRPGEVWLVARGGVLGGGPMLAAGQSRLLLRHGAGPQSLTLTLPANSFAPFSLVFR